MTTIVIMPGGFHPFHAGHLALYQSAQRAFPDAEVYVAATNDTSTRPFPFPVKEKLARLAGVETGHFVQVKSPFRAEEITAKFDPSRDTLIFVRSEKDSTKPPQPGGVKRDGSPSYLQPLLGAKRLEPFSKHAYMAYLPTVEFGPGMTSATQIRSAWPTLNEKRKTALVMSLYPRTQTSPKLAQTVVKLLDAAIGGDSVEEDISRRGFLRGLGAAAVTGTAGSAMAQHSNRDQSITAITKIAETVWNMRSLGWSRAQAMRAFETEMGYKGEVLRVAGLVCNFAWSLPKDHYSRNEFVSVVQNQASKNLPTKQSVQPLTDPKNNLSAAPSASYAGRLKGRIMPNITGQSAGPVEVEIKAGPDGTIISKRLVKSSGDSSWDQSVLQGIDKTEVLPRDTDGQVPSSITVTLGENVEQGVAEASKRKQVPKELDRDPQLRQAMLYAKQHYPQHANDPEMAMMKWLQRGLNHSEREDQQHDRRIAQLTSKVASITAAINQLKQQSQVTAKNNDYLDE